MPAADWCGTCRAGVNVVLGRPVAGSHVTLCCGCITGRAVGCGWYMLECAGNCYCMSVLSVAEQRKLLACYRRRRCRWVAPSPYGWRWQCVVAWQTVYLPCVVYYTVCRSRVSWLFSRTTAAITRSFFLAGVRVCGMQDK